MFGTTSRFVSSLIPVVQRGSSVDAAWPSHVVTLSQTLPELTNVETRGASGPSSSVFVQYAFGRPPLESLQRLAVPLAFVAWYLA